MTRKIHHTLLGANQLFVGLLPIFFHVVKLYAKQANDQKNISDKLIEFELNENPKFEVLTLECLILSREEIRFDGVTGFARSDPIFQGGDHGGMEFSSLRLTFIGVCRQFSYCSPRTQETNYFFLAIFYFLTF